MTSTIKESIYETNLFLLKNKNPTIIEYAAFHGSIQIFTFLKINNVSLTSSLWPYSIHGNNDEILYLLEENHINPIDLCYEESLKSSY